MSSQQLILGFAATRDILVAELEVRLAHVTRHLQKLFRSPLEFDFVLRGGRGIVAWQPDDDHVDWPSLSRGDQGAAAWVHIPSPEAMETGSSSPADLAFEVTSGAKHRWSVGAPFAALTLNRPGFDAAAV